MRVLCCGDRNWTDAGLIEDAVALVARQAPGTGLVIIHGGARGADDLAGTLAAAYGLECLIFPADWAKYGRAAGVIRNQQMLDEGKPDIVLAFHDDLTRSRGTADMVRRARKAGIDVRVVSHWEPST